MQLFLVAKKKVQAHHFVVLPKGLVMVLGVWSIFAFIIKRIFGINFLAVLEINACAYQPVYVVIFCTS